MRLLGLIRRPPGEAAPPGTQGCSGPGESGYGRRARRRRTFLSFVFNNASRSVSAGFVFAAQSRPRSILERSGSARAQSWLSGTMATAVSTIRPSLNHSRRNVLPAKRFPREIWPLRPTVFTSVWRESGLVFMPSCLHAVRKRTLETREVLQCKRLPRRKCTKRIERQRILPVKCPQLWTSATDEDTST
jgi:hypothetical protein